MEADGGVGLQHVAASPQNRVPAAEKRGSCDAASSPHFGADPAIRPFVPELENPYRSYLRRQKSLPLPLDRPHPPSVARAIAEDHVRRRELLLTSLGGDSGGHSESMSPSRIAPGAAATPASPRGGRRARGNENHWQVDQPQEEEVVERRQNDDVSVIVPLPPAKSAPVGDRRGPRAAADKLGWALSLWAGVGKRRSGNSDDD